MAPPAYGIGFVDRAPYSGKRLTRPGGTKLPADVQAKMEGAFDADFSAVRAHEDAQALSIGAAAFTRGSDIHFAPGLYNPHTLAGQYLLGHELSHVVQQAQGRVAGGVQGKGMAINRDRTLEREADVQGARAARGLRVFEGPGGILARYASETRVPLGVRSEKVAQAAFLAKRPLAGLPRITKIGRLHHIHIFFEDHGSPPNVGHMGKEGLGQDTFDERYTVSRDGLDDSRMRAAVNAVGDPGSYRLWWNNCQHYVKRVMKQYESWGTERTF